MTEGFEHTRTAEEVEAANATDTTNKPEFKKLDTMPGNALLAVTGVKTLYVGHPTNEPVEPGEFVWLTSTVKTDAEGSIENIRVPIIIDHVGELQTRSKLTPEQLKAAGYIDDANLKLRHEESPNYFDRAVRNAGGLGLSTADVDKLYYDTAPSSRITFHLASPAELQALGEKAPSVREAHAAITHTFNATSAAEKLGRPSVLGALDFASKQGVDILRAKLEVQNSYSNAKGGFSRQSAA